MSLERIVQLAELLKRQQDEYKRLEEEAKLAKAAYLRTEREDLPLLMNELGLTEIKLTDGSIVRITEDCDAGISDRNKAAAFEWLNDNGFGGLIKTKVLMEFGRGEHDDAVEVYEELVHRYDGVQLKEEVHPSTLKSFVKEQLRDGQSVPLDLFSVFPYSKATIKKR